MMKRPNTRLTLLLMLSLWMQTAESAITVQNGQFTANFDDVTLQDALKELAQKAKTRVVLNQPLEEKIKLGFDKVNIDKLLATLLEGYNYMLITDERGHPKEIKVMSKKANAAELAQFVPPQVPNQFVPPNQATQSPQESQEPLREGEAMIAINGTSSRALIDNGAPTSIVSFDVAQKSGMVTKDGRPPRDGDYVEVDNFSVNGQPMGKVPVIVVKGLPVGAIIGKSVIEKAGLDKPQQPQTKSKPNATPQQQNAKQPEKSGQLGLNKVGG